VLIHDDAAGPLRLNDVAKLTGLVGQRLGTSACHRVDQAQVDLFADATGDHQWIHVDPARASAGPFGTTLVHGYLTLSLLPVLLDEVFVVGGTRLTLNYGLDRVRFPAALPVGSEVSATVDLLSTQVRGPDLQAVLRVTVSATDADKPCCVADPILRYVT
jgi:acyl dehydratase